jgi:class 3 adenylate cyclase
MKAVGETVREAAKSVAFANTWGDAVHLVVSDVRSAAEICLAVQRRLARIDGALLERSDPATMRIGAHYGPVKEVFDPVTLRPAFFGRALSRAARIEPVAPPGAVYVTEPFAAILHLDAGADFACTYVGEVPLAKNYGTFRMYDLATARRPGGRA